MSIDTYILSFFSALGSLEVAKSKASAQSEDKSLPESEQATGAAVFLDLENEIARLKSAHEAFMATFTQPNPPSAQTIARAQALASDLAADIASNQRAEVILNIVVKLVDDWSQLSHAPAVAALAAGSVAAASSKPKAKGASKIKPPRALAWLKALRSA